MHFPEKDKTKDEHSRINAASVAAANTDSDSATNSNADIGVYIW